MTSDLIELAGQQFHIEEPAPVWFDDPHAEPTWAWCRGDEISYQHEELAATIGIWPVGLPRMALPG